PGVLGAEGEGTRLASRYLWIPLPSVPVMSPAMIAMTVLRAHGVARRPMLARHSGGLLNALLDPTLIFGVGLGLEEAALA
ncbi:MAG: MATE family efflux transporter, partial [Tabrizicola sp.]